jgi:hypothetical protein
MIEGRVGIAAGLRFLLGRCEERGPCSQKDQLWPFSGRSESDIQTSRLLRWRRGLREERVAAIWTGRREDLRPMPVEQR